MQGPFLTLPPAQLRALFVVELWIVGFYRYGPVNYLPRYIHPLREYLLRDEVKWKHVLREKHGCHFIDSFRTTNCLPRHKMRFLNRTDLADTKKTTTTTSIILIKFFNLFLEINLKHDLYDFFRHFLPLKQKFNLFPSSLNLTFRIIKQIKIFLLISILFSLSHISVYLCKCKENFQYLFLKKDRLFRRVM